MEHINYQLFNFINGFAGSNHFFDRIMVILANYMPVVFALYLLYLWFYKDKQIALYAGYSFTLGLIINFLISLFYFHPRPYMIGMGKLLSPHSPDTSFPSDHTTLMLSTAFALLYFKKTRIAGIILAVLGIIGGICRIYIGVHFPLDIAGSFAVSIVSSFLIYYFKDALKQLNKVFIKFYEDLITHLKH